MELMWFGLIANYVHCRKSFSNHIITMMNLWVIINVLNGIYSKLNETNSRLVLGLFYYK